MVPGDVPPTRKPRFGAPRRWPAVTGSKRSLPPRPRALPTAALVRRPPARRWRCWRHTALPLQACRLSIGAAFASAFASIGHHQNQQVSAARLPETKNQSRIARLPASLQESWPLGGKA
jgi:hypothetical protein